MTSPAGDRPTSGDTVERADGRGYLVLGDALGRPGGQGRVYAAANASRLAVKVYHQKYRSVYVPRTEQLLAADNPTLMFSDLYDQPTHSFLTWPLTLALWQGEPVGYVMPRVAANYARLDELFIRKSLLRHRPNADWEYLVTVAGNLARIVRRVHEARFVIGDLSPKNVMVAPGGLVTLIDCDSFQFTIGGTLVPATGVTPDYAPPELGPERAGSHSEAGDDYALALVTCELLVCGTHPFVGVPTDHHLEEATPAECIRVHRTRFVDPTTVRVPPKAIPLDILPSSLLALARQAFGPGHEDPDQRPPATRWAAQLRAALDSLETCSVEPRHKFSRLASCGTCPWCRQVADGFHDPFIPGRRVTTGTVPRRPVATSTPATAVRAVTVPRAAFRVTANTPPGRVQTPTPVDLTALLTPSPAPAPPAPAPAPSAPAKASRTTRAVPLPTPPTGASGGASGVGRRVAVIALLLMVAVALAVSVLLIIR